MGSLFKRNILTIVWLQVLIAVAGSLYFSEIKHFIPCTLCWFQRICLYPLVPILAVGTIFRDKKLYRYIFPLSISGWLIAFYQNLEYYGFIKTSQYTCSPLSCDIKYISWFGFVGIPLLSLIAFTVVNIGMFIYKKENPCD